MSREELRDLFMDVGEKFDEEEMDEFLGWLGLRNGGEISVARFKRLPCWDGSELHRPQHTRSATPAEQRKERHRESKGSRSKSMPDTALPLSVVDVTLSDAPASSQRQNGAAASARDWVAEEELASLSADRWSSD